MHSALHVPKAVIDDLVTGRDEVECPPSMRTALVLDIYWSLPYLPHGYWDFGRDIKAQIAAHVCPTLYPFLIEPCLLKQGTLLNSFGDYGRQADSIRDSKARCTREQLAIKVSD